MKILFLHHNMPGQFKHLAPAVAARGHETVFLSRRNDRELPSVRRIAYQPQRAPLKEQHPYLRGLEDAVLHGQQVLRMCQQLGQQGFVPNLIVAHPGWGESLFVKEVFPQTPLLLYGEFYFRPDGPMETFDPERARDTNRRCSTRIANAHLRIAFDEADAGWTPTWWQRASFPADVQPRLHVIHDGVDTAVAKPDPEASYALPDGRVLTAADEVITYTTRNFEPVRGFPAFMRSLPAILKARPKAQVVLLGDDGVSYQVGKSVCWREKMLEEVDLPPGRVHFGPYASYTDYIRLLQVSACHVYLTWPFVLSWSLIEAMAAGCLIVASDTAPVREAVRHGENGLLTDLSDPARIAESVIAALDEPRAAQLRRNARATVLDTYALNVCLPKQLQMLNDVSGSVW